MITHTLSLIMHAYVLHDQRYADSSGTQRDEEGGRGGGGSEGEEEMFVISRNSLVTPVEMVGADKIHQKTRSANTVCIHKILNTIIIIIVTKYS